MLDILNEWPSCEQCYGPVWKLSRQQSAAGFEHQTFECSKCGHLMQRTVIMSDADVDAIKAEGEPGDHVRGN